MDDTTKLRASAVRQLARRETSRRDLTRRLVSRGFERDDVNDVVDDLARRGWQSDERYAEMLVRHRTQQGYGPRRLIAELQEQGIADAKAYVQRLDIDWINVAQRAREKKYGSTNPQNWQERLRQQRFLVQRGFDLEQIKVAVGSVVAADGDDTSAID